MPTSTTKKTTTSRAKKTASRSSSPSRSTQFPGALGLLHQDHQEVEKMLKQFEKEPELELARRICMELTVHAQLEEQAFYPLVKDMGEEFQDMVYEANEEHRQVKELIAMLEGARLSDEHFEPRMKVLMDDTLHHVEEEEKQLFPKLKKQVDKARMEEWGQNLEQTKMRLMRDGGMPQERRMTEEVREASPSRR